MPIIHADDLATFRSEVLEADVPVVVDFWAEWCGPCRAVAPELEAIADEYGAAIKIVKVNVDHNPDAAAEYRVQGIPTIGLFRKGDLVEQVVGARPREAIVAGLGLERFKGTATPTAAPSTEAPAPKVEVGSDGRY